MHQSGQTNYSLLKIKCNYNGNNIIFCKTILTDNSQYTIYRKFVGTNEIMECQVVFLISLNTTSTITTQLLTTQNSQTSFNVDMTTHFSIMHVTWCCHMHVVMSLCRCNKCRNKETYVWYNMIKLKEIK